MTIKISLLLFGFTCLLFGPVLTHDLVNFDTHNYLIHNPHISDGLTTSTLSWSMTTFYFFNWHPMTWISYLIDVELYGFEPAGHHATSLVLHAANTALLFIFLIRATRELWPAIIVALLFAIHPAHVESVAWVAERKDVLSTFFLLTCLLTYQKYCSTNSKLLYGATLVLFALGLMSKPMVLTLPFILLLLDYWPLNRSEHGLLNFLKALPRLMLEKLPFFMLTIASAIITIRAQDTGGAMVPAEVLNLTDRLSNAVVGYGYYLKTAIAPGSLAAYYPAPDGWPVATVALAGVTLVAGSVFAIVKARKLPWVIVGWCFFLGTLVPVIGLVQVGAQAYADRYTYVPYIGLFIAICYTGNYIANNNRYYARYVAILATTLCLVYAGTTFQYLGHWKNSVTLWTHTLLTTDQKFASVIGLEDPPEESGQRPPGLFKGYYSLGSAYMELEQYEAAATMMAEALLLLPASSSARYLHGKANLELGNFEAAERSFQLLEQMEPGNVSVRERIARHRASMP